MQLRSDTELPHVESSGTTGLAADIVTLGYALQPALLSADECESACEACAGLDRRSAGTRCLLDFAWCRDLASRVRQRLAPLGALPAGSVAVQCNYFEKSRARNWLVPVHQDLSIPVAARVAHPSWRAWSCKEGRLFVRPPVEVLARLLAVRLHLDECGEEDGPLRLVPGSHRLGIVSAQLAPGHRHREVRALAARGDAVLLRPLVLHSSAKASGASRRRVLHLVFGPDQLPDGVAWRNAA